MNQRIFPAGWHCDCLPTGEFAVLVPGVHVLTERGLVPFHLGDAKYQPLYVRLREDGVSFAGQCANFNDYVVEYPAATVGGWRVIPDRAVGVSPVIYDAAGNLNISDGSIGSQGYRYVAPDGRLVTGDATYQPRNGHGLGEWTDLGDGLVVGQRGSMGDELQVWDGTTHRTVVAGVCRFVRARRAMVGGVDTVSLACYRLSADGQRVQDAVLTWLSVAELRALPPASVIVPPVTLPAPVPPQGPVTWAGSFFPDGSTPGNLAVWVRGAMPQGKAIVAPIELADQVPSDYLAGIWVAHERWSIVSETLLDARIAESKPVAERLRVPIWVYDDQRDYRETEIAAWCGSTPWVACPQWYIAPGEDALVFGRDTRIPGHTPFMPVIRMYTGSGAVPVASVVGAAERLSYLAYEGFLLFAWDRADGVTGVPALRPYAEAWLTTPTTQTAAGARAWAAQFFPPIVPPTPPPVPVETPVTVEQIATVLAGCFFERISLLLAFSPAKPEAERRQSVHLWAIGTINAIDVAYRQILGRPLDLEGAGSRLLLYLDRPDFTDADLVMVLEAAKARGER